MIDSMMEAQTKDEAERLQSDWLHNGNIDGHSVQRVLHEAMA